MTTFVLCELRPDPLESSPRQEAAPSIRGANTCGSGNSNSICPRPRGHFVAAFANAGLRARDS